MKTRLSSKLIKFTLVSGMFGMFGAIAAPTPACGDELLTECNFESIAPFLPDWGAGYGGAYKPATGWKTPFTVALDTSNPHFGTKAVKVSYNEAAKGNKIFHSPGIRVPASASGESRRIRIRFFYRLTGIPNDALLFSALNINKQTKAKQKLDLQGKFTYLPPTDEWQPAEFEAKIDGSEGSIQALWIDTSDDALGALYIDDFSIELVTPQA